MTTAHHSWSPGDHITLRYVGHSHGRIEGRPGNLHGWPYLVVEDRPDLLALWMPVDTRMRLINMATWEPLPDMLHGHHPHDEFRRGEVLRLMRPGDRHSVWFHWSPQEPHQFLGWYVNLEAAYVRTPIGVDTTDDSLDIVVRPDLTWEWKDEQLVQHWIDLGVYTPEEFDQFYATGRDVLADVEARRFPFDGSYLDWRPDSAWAIPDVAPNWDRYPGYDTPLSTGRTLTGVADPPPLTL